VEIGFLVKNNQVHSHDGIDAGEITDTMKENLKLMPRWKNIADIVTYLESKYNKKNLSYQKVYRQFRKIKPLLGPNDCSYFYNYLKDKSFVVVADIHKTDAYLCKLFFASKVMMHNYDFFEILC